MADPAAVDPNSVAIIIASICTGAAAIIGAWKGISAEKKAKTQETYMEKVIESLRAAQDADHRTLHNHGERLIRFEERVGKLEVLPEKMDQIRDQLVKAENDRARSEGIMTTKLDMILSKINEQNQK